MRDRGNLVLFGIALVAALCIGLLYGFNKITTSEALEIAVLTTLVIVTMWYAKSTRKMAKEAENQRYDTFRPVIDIEDVRPGPITTHVNKRQITDEEKISHNFFECVFRNYGAGAAIDVYSPYQHSKQRIGNIQAKGSKEIVTNRNDVGFIRARKIGNQWFLVAYYRDVYGRCFESKRSVNLEGEIFKIGSLKHRKLDKQKDSALINEIWPPSNGEVTQND